MSSDSDLAVRCLDTYKPTRPTAADSAANQRIPLNSVAESEKDHGHDHDHDNIGYNEYDGESYDVSDLQQQSYTAALHRSAALQCLDTCDETRSLLGKVAFTCSYVVVLFLHFPHTYILFTFVNIYNIYYYYYYYYYTQSTCITGLTDKLKCNSIAPLTLQNRL